MNKDIIKLMTDDDILEGMSIHLKYEGFKEKTIDELLGGARKILEACTRKQLCDAVFDENPEKAIRPLLDKLFPYMSFNKIGWYGVVLRIMGSCLRKTASSELSEEDKLRLKEIEREENERRNDGSKNVSYNAETDNDVSFASNFSDTENKSSIAAKKAARKLQLPFPKVSDAEELLALLKKDQGILRRNGTIKAVMEKAGPENKDLEKVMMKVNVLISVCGPNGLDAESIAGQIISCNIDDYIVNGSAEAVDILSGNLSDKRQHDFYMFAVRYCAVHDPERYPFYNPATVRAMKYCRDNHGFYNFSNDDLLNYSKYKKLLAIFRKKYRLDEFSLSEISWILTASGKLLAGK